MVTVPKKTWLSGVRVRLGVDDASCDRDTFGLDEQKLGILAFEAARTMSKLVCLHRSLSENKIFRLREHTMRSDGVQYLNSPDQRFLDRLVCAEIVQELELAAEAISRLAGRERTVWPRRLHHFYVDLKASTGVYNGRLWFRTKDMEKKMKKMEKYVAATSNLHEEMEILAEMEASERKLQRWKNYSGPVQPVANPPGADLLLKKLFLHRQLVRKIQEESLWSKNYVKVTDLMAKATLAIFAKICATFADVVPDLPVIVSHRDGRIRFGANLLKSRFQAHINYASGPLERPTVAKFLGGNSGPLFQPSPEIPEDSKSWTTKTLEPPSNTVGGSGLALRYAKVIDFAEKMLSSPELVSEEAREELYRLLPNGLRSAMSAKLRKCWKMDSGNPEDSIMGEGWRDAAERILEWLGPMARDTIEWHSERSCERRRFDPDAIKVLVLQTLCFSDREKAEAAIVEVLVGLSFVCRYQHGGCFRRDSAGEELDFRV